MHCSLRLYPESLSLAISILDRFLAIVKVGTYPFMCVRSCLSVLLLVLLLVLLRVHLRVRGPVCMWMHTGLVVVHFVLPKVISCLMNWSLALICGLVYVDLYVTDTQLCLCR